MDYELIIIDHAIYQYRKRAVLDEERESRNDRQIRYIIEQFFRDAILPKKFPKELDILVLFKDPFTKELFKCFDYSKEEYVWFPSYLAIKKGENKLVVMTIKDCNRLMKYF